MNFQIQTISIISSLLLAIVVFQLIRHRKLREDYSLLWFLASLILLIFSVRRQTIDDVADFLGIAYAPSVLLLGILFFGVLIAIQFSVSLSRLEERTKMLAQELAILGSQREQETENDPPSEQESSETVG